MPENAPEPILTREVRLSVLHMAERIAGTKANGWFGPEKRADEIVELARKLEAYVCEAPAVEA